MGTNVELEINIFGTRPVQRVHMSINKTILNILISMTKTTNIIIDLFSLNQNWDVIHFQQKSATIFITLHGFAFSYISQIPVIVTF